MQLVLEGSMLESTLEVWERCRTEGTRDEMHLMLEGSMSESTGSMREV